MTTDSDILRLRLARQSIEAAAGSAALDPPAVVERLLALQAQDYPGALWSIGLRCAPSTTAADVEHAIAERRIVRTWPMRGTLHFVAAADVRWMLRLLTPRVLERVKGRRAQLGVDEAVFARAGALFTAALSSGGILTRDEMMALLEAEGISPAGQRGYHILWTLAQQGLLCYGPVLDKQQTFVLLDEWVPAADAPPLTPAEAFGKLASRYLEAHGPATAADLVWWAGITLSEARAGIGTIAHTLQRLEVGGAEYWLPARVPTGDPPRRATGRVHLLPGFDEYQLGYTDRSLQLGRHREAYGATVSANGMFSATVLRSGRVAGTWKRTFRSGRVDIVVREFSPMSATGRREVSRAARHYGKFVGLEPRVDWQRA